MGNAANSLNPAEYSAAAEIVVAKPWRDPAPSINEPMTSPGIFAAKSGAEPLPQPVGGTQSQGTATV
ncbi:MAG: hypothetical protein AAFW98_19120 [Pseudomonadota bacterium]